MSVSLSRRSQLAALLAVPLVCCASWVGGTGGPAAAAPAATSTIPAGTVLNVGDQDQELETLFEYSGVAKAAPFKINFVEFDSGPLVNAGFAAKQIDVGSMGDLPASLAVQSGLPVKAVAVELPIGASEYLLAKPGITNISQLQGKPVAYTTGTAEQAFALRALATAGLTQKDVQQVNVSLQQLGTVLESGSADASVVSVEQKVDYQQTAPTAKVLGHGGLGEPASYGYLLGTTAALANPAKLAAIDDFTKYLIQVLQLGQDPPESVHQRLLRQRRASDPGGGEVDPGRRGDLQLRPHHARRAVRSADRRRAARRCRSDLEPLQRCPVVQPDRNRALQRRSSRRFHRHDSDHLPTQQRRPRPTGVTVEPVAGRIGAEIIRRRHLAAPRRGDDRHDPVRSRHLEGHLLQGPELDHATQIAFAQQFGDLTYAHPHDDTPPEGHPEIYTVDPRRFEPRFGLEKTEPRGGTEVLLHQRVAHRRHSRHNPPAGSILRADIVPSYGGDTTFTNLVAAYEGLSAPVRTVHRHPAGRAPLRCELVGTAPLRPRASASASTRTPWSRTIPVVRVHPRTGERALFVNPASSIASSTSRRSRAVGSSITSSTRSSAPSTRCGSAGHRGAWPSGTTEPRRTSGPRTSATSRSSGSCTGSP